MRGSNVAGFTRTDGTRTGIRRHDAPACRQFLADGAEEHRLTPLPIAVRAVCVRAMDDVGPLTRARAQGEVSLRCGPGFAQTRAALVLAESAESRNLGGLANRGGASARDAACTLGVYRRGRPEGRRADRAQPQHRPQPPGLHCDHCMCIVASSCAHRRPGDARTTVSGAAARARARPAAQMRRRRQASVHAPARRCWSRRPRFIPRLVGMSAHALFVCVCSVPLLVLCVAAALLPELVCGGHGHGHGHGHR